jgi:hypothetical protein
MKKSQLKNVLKPIVKECIQEALLEDGLLSKIISEVVKGTQPVLNSRPHVKEEKPINEAQENKEDEMRLRQRKWEQDRERRRKLLDATGLQADVFEGTEALSSAGSVNESSQGSQGPLAGMDPNDAGVDISGIMSIGGNRWKQLVK